jgi:CheY-like chemotaxis protein
MNNPSPAATGPVLVVENEPFMREAVEDILDAVGIEVLSAGSGQEGIIAYQTHREIIKLVILDLRMPGLSGAEVLQTLRSIDPMVKVIIASGYGEQEIRQALKGQTITAFLRKPYRANDLLQVVQSALSH